MNKPVPLLVFTDLDGTLQSHTDYRWDAAGPALAALRDVGAGVVLASSKTAPEISMLRDDLGLRSWPAIVENGAGMLAAHRDLAPADDAYEQLRTALDRVPAGLRAQFRGFGDMGVAGIMDTTGLPRDRAALAAQRAFSEPGIWSGTATARDAFLAELGTLGIVAREGGRFLTLSFGQTKADQMAGIIAQVKPDKTVALGDAPNDVEMLQAADHGVIVTNPHRGPLPPMKGEETGRIIRTTDAGPIGWNRAMLDLITRLELT